MTIQRLLLLSLFVFGCSSTPTSKDPTTVPPPATSASSASTKEASVDLTEIEAAIQANDGAKAKNLAEDLLVRAPKNPKVHYYAGVSTEATGDKSAAEKHYRRALELAPDFGDAAINLSALLLDMNRAADAVVVLKPLAEKTPGDEMLQTNYAAALAASGDHAQAVKIYESLLKKKPSPETRRGLVRSLLAVGNKDEAIRILKEGIAQAGNNRDLYAAFGADLAKAGAYEDAIEATTKAIQIQSSPELLTYRALFKRSLKKNEEARADLEAAIKEDPKFAAAYFYLGELLEGMKKPADARKNYEKAAELEPDSSRGKKARERVDALKKK